MRQRDNDLGRIDGGEGKGVGPGRRPSDTFDDDGKLIETPDKFADYDEFTGDNDATHDDRRRDPLRKTW